jgi:sugar phosphate isomerase/epimerase
MNDNTETIAEIFVSSGAFESRALSEVLAVAMEHSIANIELSSGIEFDPANLDLVRANAGEFNYLFHNYFPAPETPFVLNLAADDPKILEMSIAHCRRALDLTREYGAPYYSAHAGFLAQPSVEELGAKIETRAPIAREKGLEIFASSVAHLVDYAASLGVKFVVENNVVAPFNLTAGDDHIFLLATSPEINALAAQFDPKHFGILLDVGHLNVTAHTLGFAREKAFAEISGYVCALHLSDNDGTSDSNLSFDDNAWFMPLISQCDVSHIVIEAYRISPEKVKSSIFDISRQISG